MCNARITAATAISNPYAAPGGNPKLNQGAPMLVVPARARTLGTSPMSEFILSPTTPTSAEYPGFSRMKRELKERRGSAFADDGSCVSYVTDTDAGTFGDSSPPSARSVPVRRVHLMPPSYNPQWAGSRVTRSGSDASNISSMESSIPFSTGTDSENHQEERRELVIHNPELWNTPLSAASSITRPHSLARGPPPPVVPPSPVLPPLVPVKEEEVVVGRFVTYDSPVPFYSPPPPVPSKD